MYNTLDEKSSSLYTEEASSLYTEKEIAAGIETILNYMNTEWEVPVEIKDIIYLGDEKSSSELDYCIELTTDKE
jgi:hypothetical protein